VQIKLSNKDQGIFVFQLDQNNYIKFCPERGAVITNWVSDGNEILYFDQKRFMDKTKSIRGGIPILFPICGNLNTSNSVFGNDYFQLTQHGFARDLQWQYKVNDKEKSLCLFLNESKKTKKYYPFDFELRIEVILKTNCLEFKITIHNKTDINMPINFGLHPYFNISDYKNLEFIDIPLNCQNQEKNTISNTLDELNNINLGVDLLMYTSGRSAFRDKIFKRQVTLNHPYPFDLGVIWSDPSRKMICLEPWTSPRNSFVDGYRNIMIPPNDSQCFDASIQIKTLK
jgi:galactose mutarotase-like enzyme